MTSTIKVDNIQNQCGANIINESSNTITIGASGDTVTLASGASQSGFGRSGSVNWQTTKKTANFTATSGEGYFCDTNGGAFTLTLPSSPSAGDIVALKDYSGTFATNNLTIGRGGSNLDGSAADSVRIIDNESLTLVYVDSTKGWIPVEEGTGFIGEQFVEATGGNAIVTCGDFKVHVFTGPGTFNVTKVGNGDQAKVDYVVIAGGGGGGSGCSGGGAGAGGYRESYTPGVSGSYTASPLASGTSLTVCAQGYPITVGAGGGGAPSGADNDGTKGSDSVFSSITSGGGGFGGGGSCNSPGGPGGSGGGGGHGSGSGGSGNQPPVSPAQGKDGAPANSPNKSGPGDSAGGGGGAGAAATSNASAPVQGGPGTSTQMVTATYGVSTPGPARGFASGGGGATRDRQDGATPNQAGPNPNSAPNGGLQGGGGGGGFGPYPTPHANASGDAGTANTGGGGGGASRNTPSGYGEGGAGGSGIVMIRYKFQ